MNDQPKITYKQGTTGADVARYVKAIALPIGVFLLALFCISRLAAFGTSIVAPCTGFMWATGVICAIILPSQRSTILNETHVTIGGYLLGLTVVRAVIALASGVSSEMLMTAFNQAVPLTSGGTISGFLSTTLWIIGLMTPIGFIGLQGKRVFSFKRKANKAKAIDQLRNIRENGRHDR